ncbi:hypothetical protein HXZ67_13095, partial [Acinetobacter towneri]|nr:hypothetical protein [Acinetobacter towneri]
NEAWKAASEEMYKAQAEGGQAGPQQGQPNQGGDADGTQDVEYEEVK